MYRSIFPDSEFLRALNFKHAGEWSLVPIAAEAASGLVFREGR